MSQLIIYGDSRNGEIIDGGGRSLTSMNNLISDCIEVKSIKNPDGTYSVPQNITIRNFKIKGSIRVWGLGKNGQGEDVKASSFKENHTEFAQSVAPRNIKFESIEIEAEHRIPLYIAPGCTNITVKNCTFNGNTVATTIYLDCESANNKIINNIFSTENGREAIAIDGSANNLIEGNTFNKAELGGVYLYRNSGEGGTVRHQSPVGNKIANNTFNLKNDILSKFMRILFPTIWIGSRSKFMQYFYTYRHEDDGYLFGSSVDNNDLAKDNIVENNGRIIVRDWQLT